MLVAGTGRRSGRPPSLSRDRKRLAVHRRLGAVLEDAPEPFALVLAHRRLLVLGLADLSDEQHDAVENEERPGTMWVIPGYGRACCVPSRSSACFCLNSGSNCSKSARLRAPGVPTSVADLAAATGRSETSSKPDSSPSRSKSSLPAGRRSTPGASGVSSRPNSSSGFSAAIFSSFARIPSRRAPSLRSAISRVVELGIRPWARRNSTISRNARSSRSAGRDLLRLLRRVQQAVDSQSREAPRCWSG